MERKAKIGDLRGVAEWKNLDSAGDIKRFLAWCIHSIRNQTLDPRTAAIMAQIGAFMLKALEGERQHMIDEKEMVRLKDILLFVNTMTDSMRQSVLEYVEDPGIQWKILEQVSSAVGQLIGRSGAPEAEQRNGNKGRHEQS